ARAAARADTPAFTYPLLSRGERFPFVAPEAKRFSVGELGDEVDRYAAVLRGVAYVERLCFDYLDLLGAPTYGRLSLSGGGARSRYWSQLRADTLGRQVALPRDADPATGMALLARSGAASLARSGAASLADAARELTRDEEVLDPDPRRRDVLTEGYLAMVNALRERGWLPEQLADHAERRSSAGSDERGTR
ncbi:MAG: FGGY-family carbohydrate kinase, partial [Micromonosporaceae bacterium]